MYRDICILAVLSGLEIDKAKRNFGVDGLSILTGLTRKYASSIGARPLFFKTIDQNQAFYNKKQQEKKKREKKREGSDESSPYRFYRTAMDFIGAAVNELCKYARGKEKFLDCTPISALFAPDPSPTPRAAYDRCNKVLGIMEEYRRENDRLRSLLRTSPPEERDVLYEDVQRLQEQYTEEITAGIKDVATLRLLLKRLEEMERRETKEIDAEWLFYAALLRPEDPYLDALFLRSETELPLVMESPTGEIQLFSFRFDKV